MKLSPLSLPRWRALLAACALTVWTPTAFAQALFTVDEFADPNWRELPQAHQTALRAPLATWVERTNRLLSSSPGQFSQGELRDEWMNALAGAPVNHSGDLEATARERLLSLCPANLLADLSERCAEEGTKRSVALRRDLENERALRTDGAARDQHLLAALRCGFALDRKPGDLLLELEAFAGGEQVAPSAASDANASAQGLSSLATPRGTELANESLDMALAARNYPMAKALSLSATALARGELEALMASESFVSDAGAKARLLAYLAKAAVYNDDAEAMEPIAGQVRKLRASGAPAEPLAQALFHEAFIAWRFEGPANAWPLLEEAGVSGLLGDEAAEAFYYAASCKRELGDWPGWEAAMETAISLASDEYAAQIEAELETLHELQASAAAQDDSN